MVCLINPSYIETVLSMLKIVHQIYVQTHQQIQITLTSMLTAKEMYSDINKHNPLETKPPFSTVALKKCYGDLLVSLADNP